MRSPTTFSPTTSRRTGASVLLMRQWAMPVPAAKTSPSPAFKGCLQGIELAVDPGIRRAFHHEHEFLLQRVGVRVRGAAARRHDLLIDAEARQTERASEARDGGAEIAAALRLLDLGVMAYEVGARAHPV